MGQFEFPVHIVVSRPSRIWQDKVGVSALQTIWKMIFDNNAFLGLSFLENF